MLEQRIQQHFIDSADLKYQAAQTLSHPIAAAVQAVLACVTSGGKVLACGNGPSAAEAQQFAAFCVAGFERERPELAALALTSDNTLLTAAAGSHDATQQFARQVRALGQAGDVLLALTVHGNDPNLLAATEAEQKRLADVIQRESFENAPILPLGQFFIASAYRSGLTGFLKGNAPYPWNVRRG